VTLPTQQLTAKETLDMFRARSQFIITMTGLGMYFLVAIVFVLVMHRIQADQRLTIAVLILAALPKLVDASVSFWLNRSRDDGSAEKPPTITSTATPAGSSTVVTPAGNAPPAATAQIDPPTSANAPAPTPAAP
jgi:hypothetical protein